MTSKKTEPSLVHTNGVLPAEGLPQDIKLAFFDLDETLICKDTDFLWALWRSRRSPRGWIDLLGLGRINRLYYNHTLSPEIYGAYHLKRARSMKPVTYRKKAAAFAAHAAPRYIYPSMLRIIEQNRAAGIRNVLITAQDEIIGSAFSRLLNLDACIASSHEMEEGRFKAMVQPLCFREGKVHWAEKYLRENDLDWSDCVFYTDSLNDLPLLEVCAYPVTVHPGEELAALAARRSWPVLRPEKPGRRSS